MNYSSLIFRKDYSGVLDYFEWCEKTRELMYAYMYSDRVIQDDISYIYFRGNLISESKVLEAFQRFFGIYQEKLSRGYYIERISCNNGLYSLGSFKEDYENCEFISTDFRSYAKNEPISSYFTSNGTILIETYDNGSIVTDIKNNTKYYYSNDNVEFLRTFREFPLEIELVASINNGLLGKKEKFDIVDGLDSNRLSSNIRKVSHSQGILNKFSVGYSVRKELLKTGRREFVPEFWYRGKCISGRHCDNEPEAICETYKISQCSVGYDKQFLFNPINSHTNHEYLVESYVKGEITELGLIRDVLSDIAKNPFLVLRYNLIELCRKYCIYINPFKLDNEGYMINFNGTRYSELAKKYCDGVLSRNQISTQAYLS